MLWRLLWSLSRGVRPPAGGGGAAGGGLSRHRPVHPVRPCEGEPVPLGQESTQTDGSWHGRHQQHKGCGCRNLLHHYMPLDAFTLSALAVLALELVKQVRWLSSLQAGGRDVGFCQLEGHRAVLPQHQHSAPSACSSGEEKQHFFVGEDSGYALKGTSPSKTLQPKQYQFLSDTGDVLFPLSTGAEPDSCLLHLQGNPEEESVSEAASQVQRVFQASISMASNILGLEKMRNGQCKTAFSCFKLAADQNYSKAQFNVGLCYEHGRGTKRNVAKAVLYYQRAAHQGHTMAQYRYAKCLLHHCPRADSDYMQEAVGLLDQAATAGLAQFPASLQRVVIIDFYISPCVNGGFLKAKANLRLLYLKGVVPGKKNVQKHMAARSAGSSSRFHLVGCCEKGFGVSQNLLTTRMHYQQAAAAAFRPTQEEIPDMQIWHQSPLAARAFSSSPCLQSLDPPPASHLGQPALGLLHSWSTGSLRDVANSSENCMPSTSFPKDLSLTLQSLAWPHGIAIG